ncbi:MAG: hypothetical protein JWO86_9172 [Myxococcaceae bacterium]|nr:hypothetical protein [Myxococcaceae bacterium]
MRLTYQAPAGCPDADAFTVEVRARAPRSSPLGGRSVDVTVTSTTTTSRAATHFEGRVVISDESGVTPSRAVRGETCAEVVRALALTVAMTIDPAEETPTARSAVVAPPAPVGAAAPPVDRSSPEPTTGEPLHLSAGLKGGVETAVGPLVSPALGMYGELAGPHASLRLGAARSVSPLVERGAGSARFARTTMTFDGCPVRWRATPSLALVPCATFEIGSLTSDGRATVDPESSARLWVAAGLSGRLVWEPFGPIVFELEGRATAPFTRDRFFFRPADDVFQAPIVAFSGGFTGGVRFR